MSDRFIGLISGTSMDGIDAVVVSFQPSRMRLHATLEYQYPQQLSRHLQHAIRHPDSCSIDQIGTLDRQVGESFRDATLDIVAKAGLAASDIAAIGSHGQTLRHKPDATAPFSLQIGDPATIAVGTGITTVADFRRADIAAGGQGAPLVPPFHQWLFGGSADRIVLNIGGIANITLLGDSDDMTSGFDTGPGNTLLDLWCRQHLGKPFDRGGDWAASGNTEAELLEGLLSDDYFSVAPPKSTGLEHFNLDWLMRHGADRYTPENVQATLAELSAQSIAAAINQHAPKANELLVCGGGVHNADLMRRLRTRLPGMTVSSTAEAGLDPDWVEATAFAWLAMRTLHGRSGNLPNVTGASRKLVLGAIHSPRIASRSSR
jgi:anhydro-N-acetylmuramic acid kinase